MNNRIKIFIITSFIMFCCIFALTACGNASVVSPGNEQNTSVPNSTPVNTTAPHKHVEGDWVIDKEATATEIGKKHQICSICGETLKEELIPLLREPSKGLAYSVNEDGKTCEITNIGYCEDNDIIIGEYIDGYKVTSIGAAAFYKCTSITSIVIPDSVTDIKYYAFKECSSLKNVIIGNGVTSLGSSSFYACKKIETIIIPNNVKIIGDSAFYECSNLVNLTIGNGVISIDDFAFYDCKNITKIVIPDSVLGIGSSAFSGCANATSITIGNGVTIISDSAFRRCTNLKKIIIPDGVVSVGDCVFYDCENLADITIPDSITSVGYKLLFNTKYYNTPSNWKNEVLYIGKHLTEAKTTLFGTYYVKADTRTIAKGAFYECKNLSSIIIPDGVVSIGDSAFEDCSYLYSITIPESIMNIGSDSFKNTRYYNSSSKWENNVLYIGNHLIEANDNLSGDYSIKKGTKTIADNAFFSCDNLTNVAIPDSVTSIGYSAFQYCYNLTNIVIPNSVTSIGDDAFFSCDNLTNVTIPSSVTTIGLSAFYCDALTDVYYEGTETEWNVLLTTVVFGNELLIPGTESEQNALLTTIVFGDEFLINGKIHFEQQVHTHIAGEWIITKPASTTETGKKHQVCSICGATIKKEDIPVFSDLVYSVNEDGKTCTITGLGKCTDKDIIIGEQMDGYTVTNIGNSAFELCEKIRSIIIPNSVENISDSAFMNCDSLTSVVIPNNVVNIGDGVFYNCDSLTSVVIPNSVVNIGSAAFYYCTRLTNITIPDSVKSVDAAAFMGCNLKSVVIPSSLTTIEMQMFHDCENLESVTIPKSVNKISYGAFYDCDSLTDVYYEGTETEWKTLLANIDQGNEPLLNATIHFNHVT